MSTSTLPRFKTVELFSPSSPVNKAVTTDELGISHRQPKWQELQKHQLGAGMNVFSALLH